MLTNAIVKSARPKPCAYRLTDIGGLHLFVATTGTKSWRMRFRFARREQLLTIGQFPDVGLLEARSAAELAREQLKRGLDPREHRETSPVATTFEAEARAWHARQRDRWSTAHAEDVLAGLARDIFPVIGGLELDAIESPDVLDALRAIEDRGHIETARRMRQQISSIFAHAISEGRASADPASIVRRALRPVPLQKQQPAVVTIDDARELLAAIAAVPATPILHLAVEFLALTGVRSAALRGARWDEIEGIDWEGRRIGPELSIWRIPAARMKLSRAKKADARFDHVVTLSRQAVDVLRAARKNSGGADIVFPGRDGRSPIGAAALHDLHVRAGYAGRHVPHGWRATFSTIMNTRAPADRHVIDQALAHSPDDKVEAAYNRAGHYARRRVIMQEWADLMQPGRPHAAA